VNHLEAIAFSHPLLEVRLPARTEEAKQRKVLRRPYLGQQQKMALKIFDI